MPNASTSLRTIRDPRGGQVIECPVATCVEVSFTPSLVSKWRIEDSPGHLVPLSEGDHHFVFMVFSARTEPTPLRLVRYRPDREDALEERTVHVLPSDRFAGWPRVPRQRRRSLAAAG
ncbi:hypothetical protein [Nocardioides sp. KR10-350]|uniref:hypothetical protein n=1 Tax=Nocardioides cheoyonin TaxID=3156615 RepID=UPI0032B4C8FF